MTNSYVDLSKSSNDVKIKTIDLGDGTQSLSSTINGLTLPVDVNESYERGITVLYRSAVDTVDKVPDIGTITLSGVTISGTLVPGTTYYVSAVVSNEYGNTKYATVVSAAPGGSNNGLKASFTVPSGALATDNIDLFLSTDAAPKHVGRVTVAQFQTGCIVLTAEGTPTLFSDPNSVRIGAVGAGIQSNHAVFSASNAYLPSNATAIDCTGKKKIYLYVKLSLSDLRSAPALAIIPMFKNSLDSYTQGNLEVVNVLNALGQSLLQQFEMDVESSSGVKFLVDTIAGQGSSASFWYELA